MKELFGVKLTEQEYYYLLCEHNMGKDLKVIDGKVIAVDKIATEKEKAQMQVIELKRWFDTEYTKLEQKYRRLKALNILCDDGSSAEIKLLELYNMAEEKRLEIQRLGG